MSIANRHPVINNIMMSINKPNIQAKKWTILIYGNYTNLNNFNMEKIFFKLSIDTIINEISVDKIYVYINQNPQNKSIFENLIDSYNINFIEIPNTTNFNFIMLSLIKKLIDDRHNIIFLRDDNGYINFYSKILDKINSFHQIYTTFSPLKEMDSIYIPISQKYELNEIINPNVMIIPYTIENQNYINNAFKIANKLEIKNENFITNISLTIANIKSNNMVKDIGKTKIGNNFVSLSKNRIIYNSIKELCLNNNHEKNIFKKFNNEMYNNPNYIFYPYLDIDSNLQDITLIDINIDKDNSTNSDKFDPLIFNTNGFSIKTNKIYPLMFKRFDNPVSGLFIKKNNKQIIVPKIVHHVWLTNLKENINCDDSIKNYTNIWGKILREPWKYIVWTEKELYQDVFQNTRWGKIYHDEASHKIKLLIAYLAILEKYGGIVIDSFTIPLTMVPNDLLINKFMISFMNEKNFGTKLSYRVMSSVPGISYQESIIIEKNVDPARKPFEGINNFFRDIKNKKIIIKQNNIEHSVICPYIFDNMHRILSSNANNKIELIEKEILNNKDIAIYPSYYFNPDHKLPKIILNNMFCINLWKLECEEQHEKTDLKRHYKISTHGIITKLKENPKDRLKNIKNNQNN